MYNDDELFDVLTENGEKTGITKRRGDIHRDGDWHGSVHIWITRRKNDTLYVLLQKRADTKDSYPCCYDAACTGHIDAGEDAVSAALRELREEIGVEARPSDLVLIMRQNVREDMVFHGKRFISNEVNMVYLLINDIDDMEIKCEPEEVSSTSWQRAEDVLMAVKRGDEQYCVGANELQELIRCHDELKR